MSGIVKVSWYMTTEYIIKVSILTGHMTIEYIITGQYFQPNVKGHFSTITEVLTVACNNYDNLNGSFVQLFGHWAN